MRLTPIWELINILWIFLSIQWEKSFFFFYFFNYYYHFFLLFAQFFLQNFAFHILSNPESNSFPQELGMSFLSNNFHFSTYFVCTDLNNQSWFFSTSTSNASRSHVWTTFLFVHPTALELIKFFFFLSYGINYWLIFCRPKYSLFFSPIFINFVEVYAWVQASSSISPYLYLLEE